MQPPNQVEGHHIFSARFPAGPEWQKKKSRDKIFSLISLIIFQARFHWQVLIIDWLDESEVFHGNCNTTLYTSETCSKKAFLDLKSTNSRDDYLRSYFIVLECLTYIYPLNKLRSYFIQCHINSAKPDHFNQELWFNVKSWMGWWQRGWNWTI